MDGQEETRSCEFGGFRLDEAQRRLTGPSGELIELPSRAFDLLVYMVGRPGALLEKTELMQAVWPKTVVEEGNLTQCIFVLRRALGESAGEPRFIATIPGRGYQFVAPVQAPVEHPAADQGAGRALRRWHFVAAGTLVLVLLGSLVWLRTETASTPLKTIVVLPFTDLSPDADLEYFADGMTEEVSVTLAKFDGLKVLGRRSALSFKGKDLDLRALGKALKVESVLEGTVRSEGDRLRVSVQLSRTSDGFTIWSETFERRRDDILDVQRQIALEVATAMNPVLGVDGAALAQNATNNPQAYLAYLRGLHLFGRLGTGDVSPACAEFERAVRLDSRFAVAQSRLAVCYGSMAYNTAGNFEELNRRAVETANRAFEIDPTLADAPWMRWFIESENMPIEVRAHRLERALAANPADAEASYSLAFHYQSLGRTDDALKSFERAHQADAMWVSIIPDWAWMAYNWKNDRQRFLELADEMEALAPDAAMPNTLRAYLAFHEGRALDWDRWQARAVALSPRDVGVHGYLSLDYGNLGVIDAAMYHASLCQTVNPETAAGWYNVAHIQMFDVGDVTAARKVVSEAMRRHPGDFLSHRINAELQYFQGNCALAVEAYERALPSLAQHFASLEFLNTHAIPAYAWCLRKLGKKAHLDEVMRRFETGHPASVTGSEIIALKARLAAATENRDALLSNLRVLAERKSMAFVFSRHEPMIQPYLADPQVKLLLARLEERRAEWRKVLPKSSMRVPVPDRAAAPVH